MAWFIVWGVIQLVVSISMMITCAMEYDGDEGDKKFMRIGLLAFFTSPLGGILTPLAFVVAVIWGLAWCIKAAI